MIINALTTRALSCTGVVCARCMHAYQKHSGSSLGECNLGKRNGNNTCNWAILQTTSNPVPGKYISCNKKHRTPRKKQIKICNPKPKENSNPQYDNNYGRHSA